MESTARLLDLSVDESEEFLSSLNTTMNAAVNRDLLNDRSMNSGHSGQQDQMKIKDQSCILLHYFVLWFRFCTLRLTDGCSLSVCRLHDDL